MIIKQTIKLKLQFTLLLEFLLRIFLPIESAEATALRNFRLAVLRDMPKPFSTHKTCGNRGQNETMGHSLRYMNLAYNSRICGHLMPLGTAFRYRSLLETIMEILLTTAEVAIAEEFYSKYVRYSDFHRVAWLPAKTWK